MAVYMTRWFGRWCGKVDVTDVVLCRAVREMQAGLVDAELGSGLVKKRIARAGQGKSGGYRTLVATNRGDCWIFMYGFPKNARGNIGPQEEMALKKLTTELLSLTAASLRSAQAAGELLEVNCHA